METDDSFRTGWERLFYVTFDETAARVASVDVSWSNRVMSVLTAMVSVAAQLADEPPD